MSDTIDPATRTRTVFIPESGITDIDVRSIVQIDGPVVRNITIRLVPLTYDEYETMFPSINLNNVFPSRPLPAERMLDYVLNVESLSTSEYKAHLHTITR